MTQRRPLIVGNWKMHGSLASNAALLAEIQSATQAPCDIAVCVPFPYLEQTQSALGNTSIKWGAQDVSAHAGGAYTGEVSATMLADFACRFCIVGHSERRQYHAESDNIVGQKAKRLLEQGITPIVCVGETLQERKDNLTESTVARQLNAVLSAINAPEKIVLAYEPVWAIGTGVTATPDMAQQVHAFLRQQLALVNKSAAQVVPILYGGSMKPDNAAALLCMDDIDGGLIGGASLKAVEFLAIVKATRFEI
jgi:triosephosphate isomerase